MWPNQNAACDWLEYEVLGRLQLAKLTPTFGASRKFRMLAVNDDSCRENPCLMADTSISGAGVARELDALVRIAVFFDNRSY